MPQIKIQLKKRNKNAKKKGPFHGPLPPDALYDCHFQGKPKTSHLFPSENKKREKGLELGRCLGNFVSITQRHRHSKIKYPIALDRLKVAPLLMSSHCHFSDTFILYRLDFQQKRSLTSIVMKNGSKAFDLNG